MLGISLVKEKVKPFLQYILYLIASRIPKKPRFVLRGFPDYEDNLIAIYEELLEIQQTDIIWVVNDPAAKTPIKLELDTKVIKRGSPSDIYYSITSKYLFITHGHFLTLTPKNQVCINLWHGIPFKQIGIKQGMRKRNDTYLICTSAFTKKILHESFKTTEKNIHITGQPRTDRMLNTKKEETIKRLFGKDDHPNKLFIWLPTYRQSSPPNKQKDEGSSRDTFNCSDFSSLKFNETLRKNNAFCIVKPHPMAQTTKGSIHSNILFINEKWLMDRQTSLYQLIGAADCLISDISSVIADFMLLNRPIILLFEDIEEYKNSRGFSLNPITDFLPADVMTNFNEFMIELKKVLNNKDVYQERRENMKNLFFHHFDNNAAKRVLNLTFTKTSDSINKF